MFKNIAISLFVSSVALSGCSSSNNGTVLPDDEVDNVAPRVRSVEPPEVAATLVPTNSQFRFDYDELLDSSTLSENVTLNSLKSRNIFETSLLGSKDFNRFDVDKRAINLTESQVIFTRSRTEVVRETIDEDGVKNTETRTVIDEVPATTVFVEPQGRLALWSLYSLEFGAGIRDLSPIESISPIDGSVTTGNFASPNSIEFGTADGEWRSFVDVNNDFLSNGFNVSKVDFVSADDQGYVAWLQQSQAIDALSLLYIKEFNQDSQSLVGQAVRLDYVDGVDGGSNVSNDVLDFSTSIFGNEYCATWSYKETASLQGVYLRCASGDQIYPRINFVSHSAANSITSLGIHMTGASSGFVSYLYDEQLYVYSFSVASNSAPTIDGSEVVGGGSLAVVEVEVVDYGNDRIDILVVSSDTSKAANEQYTLEHAVYQRDNGLSSDARLIQASGTLQEDISGGFDYLQRGVVGWSAGAGFGRNFFTAKFNGASWSTPSPIAKNANAVVVDSDVFVFDDGQVLFTWISQQGGEYTVSAQGLFPVDSNSAFVIPSVIKLDSSFSEISEVQVMGDREGNALVLFARNPRNIAVRFRQNIEWNSAWGDAEDVGVYGGTKPVLKPIAQDGRFMLLDKQSRIGFDAAALRVFSDFN